MSVGLSLSVFVRLSVSLSVCLCVCVCLSVCLWHWCQFIVHSLLRCLSVCVVCRRMISYLGLHSMIFLPSITSSVDATMFIRSLNTCTRHLYFCCISFADCLRTHFWPSSAITILAPSIARCQWQQVMWHSPANSKCCRSVAFGSDVSITLVQQNTGLTFSYINCAGLVNQ